MAKITIEIEKAKGGGYIMWRDGELAFAASHLFELYETLGDELRSNYGSGIHRPHATVHRIAEDVEPEAPAPRAVPRKAAEPPPVRPAASYVVPNPRPRTEDLVKEQAAHLNGFSTGLADRVPAVG